MASIFSWLHGQFSFNLWLLSTLEDLACTESKLLYSPFLPLLWAHVCLFFSLASEHDALTLWLSENKSDWLVKPMQVLMRGLLNDAVTCFGWDTVPYLGHSRCSDSAYEMNGCLPRCNSQTWLVGLGGNLLESEKLKHCCHKLYSIGKHKYNERTTS